jgi:hypothetical protein
MVFIGGWRTGRPRNGYHDRYGRPRHGYGGGSSCLRDLYLIEIGAKRLRPCCRHLPSCSSYPRETLELRCRPGGTGGDDPVPPRTA